MRVGCPFATHRKRMVECKLRKKFNIRNTNQSSLRVYLWVEMIQFLSLNFTFTDGDVAKHSNTENNKIITEWLNEQWVLSNMDDKCVCVLCTIVYIWHINEDKNKNDIKMRWNILTTTHSTEIYWSNKKHEKKKKKQMKRINFTCKMWSWIIITLTSHIVWCGFVLFFCKAKKKFKKRKTCTKLN